ncbi:hypothetical protein A8G88_07690 [Acinetobacter baumannii]|nr:hypothetical protein A8G88_07690 [Acinetobacter baumannii]
MRKHLIGKKKEERGRREGERGKERGKGERKRKGKEVAHTRNRTKSKITGKMAAIAEKNVVVNGGE